MRQYRPSTASRLLSVVAGFHRTCVIDVVLEHSPAEYVRRPHVPAQSPTLGLTHLQFEAMLTAARQSPNRCDFALVTMLGLLGLRIFEATGSDIEDLGAAAGLAISFFAAWRSTSRPPVRDDDDPSAGQCPASSATTGASASAALAPITK